MRNYLIAAIKPWNREEFNRRNKELQGDWYFVDSHEKLTEKYLNDLQPKYIFFPHWSWQVPENILNKYECVCFHMTDLPYGRGGSPLQNLIKRGHNSTKITALKMISIVDAGPVYLKHDLDLSGKAQNIYERASKIIFDMIEKIIEKEIIPIEQTGEVTFFKRLSVDDNSLSKEDNIKELFDHIRMLDAETYPKSFIDYGKYRIEFSNAEIIDNKYVSANAIIREKEPNEK
jgi:methionyl-tRNA formyltransferase